MTTDFVDSNGCHKLSQNKAPFTTPYRHADVANNLICKDSNRRNFAESK